MCNCWRQSKRLFPKKKIQKEGIDEFRMVLGGQPTPFCFYPLSRVTRNCKTIRHEQLQIQRTKQIKPDFPSTPSEVLRTITLSLTTGRVKHCFSRILLQKNMALAGHPRPCETHLQAFEVCSVGLKILPEISNATFSKPAWKCFRFHHLHWYSSRWCNPSGVRFWPNWEPPLCRQLHQKKKRTSLEKSKLFLTSQKSFVTQLSQRNTGKD